MKRQAARALLGSVVALATCLASCAHFYEKQKREERRERERATAAYEAEQRGRRQEEQERQNRIVTEENERRRQKWMEETRKTARSKGYKDVLFDVGLSSVLDGIVAGQAAIKDYKGVAIMVDQHRDPRFTVLQVLDETSALFAGDHTDVVVMMKRYGEQLLEGPRGRPAHRNRQLLRDPQGDDFLQDSTRDDLAGVRRRTRMVSFPRRVSARGAMKREMSCASMC